MSGFAGGFAILVQERWAVSGICVGARIFEGISCFGGNSEGGTASVPNDAVGGGVGGSLATIYIEFKVHVATKLLPSGRLNLVTADSILGQGLGCEGNGWPHADFTLADLWKGFDGARLIHVPKVLVAGLDRTFITDEKVFWRGGDITFTL